ncbi:MAG TPA: luciferase family protein [Chthoniobacterales bacterium]|nr:luciferase family protein [Chthoniobacterales bacterium]
MVRSWPGMGVGVHRLGGIGFFFRGRECSHIHGNGLLDCFVGREKRDQLVANGQALPHHVFPNSGWISFWVENETDIEAALGLIRIAAAE